ncbi:MAG: DUF5676 family membrane protein [Candidatus Woesearchaeota archaeon]|nr:DUF5676 family membrane protein [Candidatus Woesearchaeota archaeon]
MEKLNVKTTALTLAIVGGVLSLACAAIIAIWPGSLKYLGAIFHGIDLTAIAKTSVSIGSVILGLIEVVVIGAIVGALFAWLYNYFNEKIK